MNIRLTVLNDFRGLAAKYFNFVMAAIFNF